MANIPVGHKGEEHLLVTTDVAIDFMGLDGARVLSTPQLVRALEITARNSVLPLLEDGHDTVGTHVNVFHLAASPLGSHVVLRSEVLTVQDRRVNFKVEAFDERDKIAEGTHERFIINVERFAARMKAKFEEIAKTR